MDGARTATATAVSASPRSMLGCRLPSDAGTEPLMQCRIRTGERDGRRAAARLKAGRHGHPQPYEFALIHLLLFPISVAYPKMAASSTPRPIATPRRLRGELDMTF